VKFWGGGFSIRYVSAFGSAVSCFPYQQKSFLFSPELTNGGKLVASICGRNKYSPKDIIQRI